MLEKKACKFNRCNEDALSLSSCCWPHLHDKEAYKNELIETLNRTKSAHGFNLKKIVLEGIELTNVDFSESNMAQSSLTNSNLFHNNFSKADLMGADLALSDLTGTNLSGADLTMANLRGVRFWHADLSAAILAEADLSGADMWQSKLYKARLWRTDFTSAKYLSRQNFAKGFGNFITVEKIDESTHLSAEDVYRDLKRYFIAHGRYDDASWASFKEKTMEKVRLKKDKNIAFIPVALMGLLSGYGEKPHRVILSSGFLMFFYAVAFYLLDGIRSTVDIGNALTFWDYVYYSVVTFTTVGYGDIVPKINITCRMLAISEAFIGAFMIGLFVFTLARRYSAR